MNYKQIIAVSAVVLFALCLMPAADAASIESSPSGTVKVDNMNGGGFDFTIDSNSGFDMTVTVSENNKVLSTQEFTIKPGTNTIHVDLGFLDSVGTHFIRIECEPAGMFDSINGFNVTVEVTQNILSNWAVYGAIAAVVIIIVIFAYIKMRDTPKAKPEMTFEELEAQRKAEMAAKAEKKQKPAVTSSTEKKKYIGGKKTEEPKAKPKEAPAETPAKEKKVKEEKPKMTFEELEAQRKAEMAAKAEKKQQKKSTGLTERERYLEEKRKKKEQE